MRNLRVDKKLFNVHDFYCSAVCFPCNETYSRYMLQERRDEIWENVVHISFKPLNQMVLPSISVPVNKCKSPHHAPAPHIHVQQ